MWGGAAESGPVQALSDQVIAPHNEKYCLLGQDTM